MGSSPDDADLERLLAQLLRAVNPAAMTNGAATDQPAAGDGVPPPAPDAALDDWAAGGVPSVERAAGAGPGPMPTVSASESRALIELLAARGIAQGQLATLLGLEKSTVSRLAAGLERKGWVRRGRDEENQRYIRLYLTRDGGVVAARVWQAWQSRQARILGALSADERAGLAAGLRGLVRGLAAEGLLGDAGRRRAAASGTPGPAGQPPGR